MMNYTNRNTLSLSYIYILIIISILSLSSLANGQAVAAIQGYIYWDQNSNGLLEDYNNELDNGLIGVEVELRPCGDINADRGMFICMLIIYY